ncbi:radical SAM protein [Ancylothrix sp. C2]|uniref:radical SAM protein n=1 Tax=Ancylothrix sp. D3o TaxID=2953691 RepID=UPI0021BACD1C|nr:radical SAM protein [Ancylothrix sp. D3o]MCT7948390.1 radical SAM protein [Ancylothrix sp. D3o]
MMLLLFVRLFGLNDRPKQPGFKSSDVDLDPSGSTGLYSGNLGEEIQKVGKVYRLERRFLL